MTTDQTRVAPLWCRVISVLVVGLLFARQVNGDAEFHLDGVVQNPLPQPMLRSCAAQLHQTTYLLGGDNAADPTKGSKECAEVTVYHSAWIFLPTFLLFSANGHGFCALSSTDTSALFFSAAARHSGSTLGGSLMFKFSTSQGWSPLQSSTLDRSRGVLVGAAPGAYLFGGLNSNNEFVSQVEVYNETSNAWDTGSVSMLSMNSSAIKQGGACDCTASTRANGYVYLVCQSCYTNPANFSLNIIKYDLSKKSFELMSTIDTGKEDHFLSFTTSIVAQYLVISVVTAETGSKGGTPALYYYDIVTKLYWPVTPSFFEPRFAGTTYFIEENFYYAGGRNFSYSDSGTIDMGGISQFVQRLHAFADVHAALNHVNHTYVLGEEILIQVGEIYDCSRMRFRLASSRDCQQRVSPNIQDATCAMPPGSGSRSAAVSSSQEGTSGVATLLALAAVGEAYLCVSFGTCAGASEAETCSVAGVSSPYECVTVGCCWDGTSCRKYQPGTPDKDAFFFNVDSDPVAIVIPHPNSESSPPFFRTKAGIVTICVCAAIVVVLAVATIAYFQRRNPGLEHPLESNSKYRLVSKLGQGGFGTVFLVQKKGAATEQYAMKYIACQSEEDRHYAMKEFELIRSAQGHPNMIRLVDMFMSWSNEASIQEAPSPKDARTSNERQALLTLAPRYVCIVMDYFKEGDLSTYILEHCRQGASEHFVRDVMCRQVCTLLQHLHALNPPIVHRDLKPENLLLADDAAKVVVTDFGLAQQVEKSYMTTRAGSLHYVAPECWKRHYTAAVDMWGLGCIMYAACTGRVTADTARVMFSDARDRGFEKDIRYDLRRFSPLLADVIIGLLRVDPLKRLTSSQVLELLDNDSPS